MAVNFLVFLIIIPLIFGIPILIGIYVYRDAAKRGMNAPLWTLIALFTPSLLGLIIYLLVRNNHSDLTCPNCNTRVEESYVVCPNCRTKLRPTCNTCGAMIQTGWKVCPHCGTDLPEYDYNSCATPIKQKDNTLGKILIAILVIPIALILLLLLLALPLSFNTQMDGYSTVFSYLSMDEFLADLPTEKQEQYAFLFNKYDSSTDDSFYLFQYETFHGEENEFQYIIYLPGATGAVESSIDIETEGFLRKKNYLELELFNIEKNEEQQVFLFTYRGSVRPEYLELNYNGREYTDPIITYSDVPLVEW